MDVSTIRALIGDMDKEFISDEMIQPFMNDPNAHIAAANVIDSYLAGQLIRGAGTSIKTDDLTVNQYNNLALLRDHAKGLRSRGEQLIEDERRASGGVAMYWPSGVRIV